MKNILIINQALANHGDEAAHRGLVRNLSALGNVRVKVLFFSKTMTDIEKKNFLPDDVSNVEHYYVSPLPKEYFLSKWTMLLPDWAFKMISWVHPSLNSVMAKIRESDFVISAPGGLDLGLYRNWRNLWRLRMAIVLGKSTAIYSPSIGPWPNDGFLDRLFTKRAKQVLRDVDFLSLRDEKSQQLAQESGISYFPSIDTAFADKWVEKKIPDSLNGFDFEKHYVVLVPNLLCGWHREFKDYDKSRFDKLYVELLKYLVDSGMQVVMLPQQFGQRHDQTYFEELATKVPSASVFVVPDEYNADVQQSLVSQARFLIGGRYHSIIFGIRSRTPLISLSYEHKMKNTLTMLGLERFNLDMHDVLVDGANTVIEKLESEILNKYGQAEHDFKEASFRAIEIATQTFDEFSSELDKAFENKKRVV